MFYVKAPKVLLDSCGSWQCTGTDRKDSSVLLSPVILREDLSILEASIKHAMISKGYYTGVNMTVLCGSWVHRRIFLHGLSGRSMKQSDVDVWLIWGGRHLWIKRHGWISTKAGNRNALKQRMQRNVLELAWKNSSPVMIRLVYVLRTEKIRSWRIFVRLTVYWCNDS